MAKYGSTDPATQRLRNVTICLLVQLGKRRIDTEGKEKVRSSKVSFPQELFKSLLQKWDMALEVELYSVPQ